MKIKEIICLGSGKELLYEWVDVLIELEDGNGYTLEVTTPQNLLKYMEDTTFVGPMHPFIVVSDLRIETIKSAVQALIDEEEDEFWLKLYHVTGCLYIEDINLILKRKREEYKAYEDELDAESDSTS